MIRRRLPVTRLCDSVVFHLNRATRRALGRTGVLDLYGGTGVTEGNVRDDPGAHVLFATDHTGCRWVTPQQSSYETSYAVAVADTITFRPDGDTSKALEVLTKDGTAVSVAVRTALIDPARRKASAAIRAEAERLAEDESDRAEAMQVLRDMETLRPW